jgi:hypothetical protein
MRKAIAVLLAILLIPVIPTADAETNLLDVGIIDSIDGRFIHTSFTSSSTLLTLTSSGNLSEHFWGSGALITQWSIELNASVNSATPDSTGLVVAVAHTGGVYVVNTQLKIITVSYNTSSSVDYVLWDAEGELWFGHFGGERRAKEYNPDGWTGISTPTHNTAMTAMAIISDNRIVTGGRDNLVKITTQGGVLERTLSDFTSYPTKIINDGNGNIIIGCVNGDVFRYDFTDWSHNETSISSSESIISINLAPDGRIMLGTQNGNLHILDDETFTEEETFSSPGRVMMGIFGDNGELYIISSFSTSSQIRLYDLDSDGDGVTDNADDFPLDSTQEVDTDGDGYGDDADGNNSDAFPVDVSQWNDTDGDGYGDNLDGNNSDAFPTNSEQWMDSDGDGYGDNMQAEQGDRFPEDSTQWLDSDYDGYGDEGDGNNGDNCPQENGFSTIDRKGCKDSDSDGYSDPTEDWTTADGADSSVNDKTQWEDYDGDGYGDNLSGNQADTCPLDWGNSTNTYVPEIATDGSLTLTYVVKEKFGCLDSDGDGFDDFGDDLPNDARDYIDNDKDDIGASQDYNDSNKLVQTKEDHCVLDNTDQSEMCLGIRDVDYQNYVINKESDGDTPKGYYDWKRAMEPSEEEVSGSDYLSTAAEILPFLGAGFAAIVAVLLIYAAIGKSRRRKALVKAYGIPLPEGETSAEDEVLEGKEGLSGAGGIDDEHYWDDEVKPIEFTDDGNESDSELEGEFDNIEIKGDGELPETSEVLEESSSIEELAGLPEQEPTTEEVEVSSLEEVPQPEAPEMSPLPAEGLPDGWTMEQWKWYGAEWLAKQGK